MKRWRRGHPGERLRACIDEDGLWHVVFPTARTTPCGLVLPDPGVGRRWPPTCPECRTLLARSEAWRRAAPQWMQDAIPRRWRRAA